MSEPDGGPGAIYEQADKFALELAKRDAALARRIAERYGQTYVQLAAHFDNLSLAIQQDIARGQVFTIDRLRRLDRYAALMQQVDAQMAEFAQYAAGEIQRQQATEVHEALRTAAELRATAERQGLLDRPTEQGRGELPPGASEQEIAELYARMSQMPYLHLIGTLTDGTPLYNYLINGTANVPGLSAEVIAQIDQVLSQALIEGWNPRKAAAMFREAMGVGLTRALAIARTEILRSYREATRQSYIAYGVRQWQWEATFDERTCLACAMLDGRLFDVNEPQAAHVNCRCTMVPVMGDMGPRERRTNWHGEDGMFTGNGEDWLGSLSDDQLREIMGEGNYNAYKAGAVTLDDFIGERYSDVFGKSYVQESLVRILGEDASQYYAR